MQNLTNLGTIREIMDRFGFTFSKSLGQNFIVNSSVCPRIAELGGFFLFYFRRLHLKRACGNDSPQNSTVKHGG